ncbi:MAG: hypothetical protein ACF8R7_18240 [Phycisphaerales bacterium JB039]
MHRPSRIALTGALAAAVLSSAGCVVAIGNRPAAPSSSERVRLDSDQLASIPEVESASELPSFDVAYADQLRQLSPQTTIEEFRELFPQARFMERNSSFATPVDAFAVIHKQVYRFDGERRYGHIKRDERWFYFRSDVLVKQGEARDWPAPVRGEGQ